MIMRLILAFMLFIFVARSPGNHAENQPKATDSQGASGASEKSQTPVPSVVQNPRGTETQLAAQEKHEDASPKPAPFMSHAEWIMSVLTLIYVGLTGFYVYYSRQTLAELQRQIELIEKQDLATKQQLEIAQKSADAATNSLTALLKIERPFVIIEQRNHQFWAVNYGKSPAQIVFIEPVLKIAFPTFDFEAQDWSLPNKPNYGQYYDHPTVEVINVQWIAPGKELFVNSFYASEIIGELDEVMKAEINSGNKAIFVYSAIKYRGIVSSEIFENRYCYRCFSKSSLCMSGPYGYNLYT
jgi:hypothetical protein